MGCLLASPTTFTLTLPSFLVSFLYSSTGKFLTYALKKPEVRFVTYSDLVRWMQVSSSMVVWQR